MWNELVGKFIQKAGVAATETLPVGSKVVRIYCGKATAGATCTIFGGTPIPILANVPLDLQFNHTLCVSKSGATDIVFTGTESYYLEYVQVGY